MKKTTFLGAMTVASLAAGAAAAATLEDIQSRGTLNCGVVTGLAGFGAPNANGEWEGFDVAVCRAVAAAVLGDPTAVTFVPTTGKTRFTALASGEIDMLARNTTWTFSRDTDLKFDFVGINYYDGQGFIVPNALGVSSAKDLDGATICIQTGTTTELNLADYFRANNISYEPVPIETNAEGPAAVPRRRLRRLHDGRVRPRRHPRHLRDPGRPHHPARDHLQGAARTARASRRQRVGRHRPLDAQRAHHRRGAGDHIGQRAGTWPAPRATARTSIACSAPRASSAR